jgi:hypothetical protein
VSVQTLHPTKFDHGKILAQTDLPGIPVYPEKRATADLTQILADEGTRLLSQVIQRGLFVPPISPIERDEKDVDLITMGKGLSKAPKITKEDSRVSWANMDAATILLRHRVFGSLWDEDFFDGLSGARVLYERLGEIDLGPQNTELIDMPAASPFVLHERGSKRIVVKAKGGSFVEILDCTIAGDQRGKSMRRLLHLLWNQGRRYTLS